MPLGTREYDDSNSNLCGVLTEFTFNLADTIDRNLTKGGFDFLVTPLMHPDFRPSMANLLVNKDVSKQFQCGSDFSVSPAQWNSDIIGKVSSWIDLDSEDETVRMDSEAALKHEINWASYLCLKACLLPAPKGTSYVNYARCVKQILQGQMSMQLWLRCSFGMSDDDSRESSTPLVDSWKTWNLIRQLCDQHSQLKIALDIARVLPSENSRKRWFGEPVVAAIIDSEIFNTRTRGRGNTNITMSLSKRHQKLITEYFDHSIQIIISGKQVQPMVTVAETVDLYPAADSKAHPLWPCLDHIGLLYNHMAPLTDQEGLEFCIRDFLLSPSRPILSIGKFYAFGHDRSEKDIEKYSKYESAIRQALLDTVPKEKTSEITAVLYIAGAGRGPLVRASVHAAKATGRKLRVYAVEKNPHVAMALKEYIKSEAWNNIVTVIIRDVRSWTAPGEADILVSDLLGSFGDDELSPECIDGALRLLKENGISIPSSYTSFLQPLTASKLYNSLKAEEDILQFESAFVVKSHSVAQLAPSQPVFTFTHPKHSDKDSNQRHKKLLFVILDGTESAMVHGFAGYFDATLYKDVHIVTEPSTATPKVFTWHPMFFPLRTPVCVHRGSTLEVHFWRCCDSTKVWYEWCVTSPCVSPIHNRNGCAFSVGL